MHIDFFGPWRNRLGESPLWDGASGWWYWVDTIAQRLCRASAAATHFQSWLMPNPLGSIALAEGGLLAAMGDGFHFIDLHRDALSSSLARPEQGNASVRFNDGKADRQGRFIAGTMRIGDCTTAPGALYRLEQVGECSLLERDIAVTNAICFSPSGAHLYCADSLQSVIWRYDYYADSTLPNNRQVLIDTAPLGSVPDGATVDAAGNLWVALFQTQQIAQFDATGKLLRRIDLPAPYPSCPAFGGEDLQTLLVTTISDSGHRIRTDHPAGGRMLMIDGLDACGLPEARCQLAGQIGSQRSIQ